VQHTVTVTSTFTTPKDIVFNTLMRTDTLRFLVRPLTFSTPLAEHWVEGQLHNLKPHVYGIPLGSHHIYIKAVNQKTGVILTEERSRLFREWKHTMLVTKVSASICTYTDKVTIDAGSLTPYLVPLIHKYYKRRHARWPQWLEKQAHQQR
jgi:hypothetical protein